MPGELAALANAAPSSATVSLVVLAFLAGATCPTYYAQERLRGFGRTMFDRLPYRPPPGMDQEQAMQAAMETAEDAEDEVSES